MHTTTAQHLLRNRNCRLRLSVAREDALEASTHLDGARAKRADQLAEQITNAIAIGDRLAFVVEGDRA